MFNLSRKYTIEEVRGIISNLNPNIVVLSNSYKSNKEKIECLCLLDGHKWEASFLNLKKVNEGKSYGGCIECNKKMLREKILKKNRSIKFTHPKESEFLKDRSSAYKIIQSDDCFVECVCVQCGLEKTMKVKSLCNNGFRCNNCMDGFSVPEKIISSVLSQIGIVFHFDTSIKWSQNKRYDFYIPSLNIIIEAHGIQHYKYTGRGRSLEEEQENDKLKEKLARENGIEHYIVIDCRKSDFEWLRENCVKNLEKFLKFSDVDWSKAYDFASSSLIKKAWELYLKKYSVYDISDELNITPHTVRKYLKLGDQSGVLLYKPDGKNKKVIQLSRDGLFIKEHRSLKHAGIDTNTMRSDISSVCSGKLKTAGGFIWKYSDEAEI